MNASCSAGVQQTWCDKRISAFVSAKRVSAHVLAVGLHMNASCSAGVQQTWCDKRISAFVSAKRHWCIVLLGDVAKIHRYMRVENATSSVFI